MVWNNQVKAILQETLSRTKKHTKKNQENKRNEAEKMTYSMSEALKHIPMG